MSKFKETGILNFQKLQQLNTFMFGHKGFIAGGCFKDILNNQPYRDVDVYFENIIDFEDGVNFYKDEMKNDDSRYIPSYTNDKVYAVYDKQRNVRIELIKSIFGTPEEIISQFDFTITKFAYHKWMSEEDFFDFEMLITYHEDFFEHLHMKRLVIDDELPFPISSFNRSYKYQSYGYGLCKESKLKLLQAINGAETVLDKDVDQSLYNGWD